jgi:DNA-binding beta-propeller fold protein YncE
MSRRWWAGVVSFAALLVCLVGFAGKIASADSAWASSVSPGLRAAAGRGSDPQAVLGPRASPVGICDTAVAQAPSLSGANPQFLGLSQPPFGVVARGHFAFVALPGSVQVMSTATYVPKALWSISVPLKDVPLSGVGVTRDGRYLLLASGSGAVVVSVKRAELGQRGAVLGTLSPPAGISQVQGAIEVTASADGHFVFVSNEAGSTGSGNVAVYNLTAAIANRFRRSTYVGAVTLGEAVVGSAMSPDGRWMYVTSEIGARERVDGTLSVISVAEAERHPSRSVVATTVAGCSPVRVVVSADGQVVWVTARGSDSLLAYSATKLRTASKTALLTTVRVGEAPVGLALVDAGRFVVVADSNRFEQQGASSQLSVVNTDEALHHEPALTGTVQTGAFPREMTLTSDGDVLLISDYASREIEAIRVKNLEPRENPAKTFHR